MTLKSKLKYPCMIVRGTIPPLGNTFLLAIAAAALPLNPYPAEEAKPASAPVSAADVRAARRVREQFLADPYRPGYHFCVPDDVAEQGAFDPNGAFYHNGRYHLMYLYNRNGGIFGPPFGPSMVQPSPDAGCAWGHVSSQDLVHWRHHPDAIGPGQGDEGCFSGGAFVDDDGTAYTNAKELCFDATRSGVEGRKVVEHLPLELKPGEPLKLRVFVDKSVVEIYANDRQAICRMVYPSRPNSLGVALFANGGQAKFNSVKAWEMAPSNPY